MVRPGYAAAPTAPASDGSRASWTVEQEPIPAEADERARSIVRFGVFEADLESRELHRSGGRGLGATKRRARPDHRAARRRDRPDEPLGRHLRRHARADCLALQAEVAGRVARALAVELLGGTTTSRADCCTENVEAYQAYLKGRYHWNTLSAEGSERALAYYTAAIELDPGFARAHAALARARVRLVEYRDQPIRHMLEAARDSAVRSLRLDPSLSWGHLALASVKTRLNWDWDGAASHYRQALTLGPNCEAAHFLYGRFLAAMNRPVEARALLARACEIDPLCLVVTSSAAWVHYVSRSYDDAIRAARHVLDMDPGFESAHRLLGAAYLEVGRFADAVDHFRHAAALEARHPVTLTWLAHGLAAAGHTAEAEALLAELTSSSPRRYVSPYRLALVHSGLGDIDAAFEALEMAHDERAVGIVNLAVEPRFDPLRSDARFGRLLSRLGLEN